MEFTLKEAISYYKNNKLNEWIQEFLRAEDGEMPNPNFALADGLLLEERQYFCPLCIPIEELKTVRVEKDIKDADDLKYYLYKVDKIIEKLQHWDMPPLIVQFDGTDFILTDGSHRYSALKKMGKAKYYAIIWCNKDMKEKAWQEIKGRGWCKNT